MPIVIRVEGKYLAPVVLCDHCGQKIAAREGNYQWKMASADLPEDRQLYFTHKKCCKGGFEDSNSGNFRWAAEELKVLPLYLVNNLEINWDESKEYAKTMSQF